MAGCRRRLPLGLRRLQRQQCLDDRLLPGDVGELGVDHIEPIDGAGDVGIQVGLANRGHFGEGGLVFKVRMFGVNRHLPKAEGRNAPLARDRHVGADRLRAPLPEQPHRLPDDI